jgi:hypothetical protein
MKKTFFLFAMLASVTASAQTLNIQITKMDYSTKIATCDISWTGRNATHLSDVWVFVDYIEISGNAPAGSWQPAAITGATVTKNTTGNAAASIVSGNTRGVWVKSTTFGANFTGEVKLQLSSVPAKFNACAYVTDYPPNAASYNAGTYTLKGTKPFTITGNGVIQNGNKYVGTVINSLTDATGCPGGIGRDEIHNGGTCAPGLTAVGGYCRDLTADVASSFTGCGIEVKSTTIFGESTTLQCPIGWRFPNHAEITCMFNNATQLVMSASATTESTYVFVSPTTSCNVEGYCGTPAATGVYIMFFGGRYCASQYSVPQGGCTRTGAGNGGFGRCVR